MRHYVGFSQIGSHILLWYDASSAMLRDTVPVVCCKLCNTITPRRMFMKLVASRLIALNQCPGVRPIGIGVTLHRVVRKTICLATHIDVTLSCGFNQLCARLSSGIEGAIHAMNSPCDQHCSPSGWEVLMVDASNAFNSLNCTALSFRLVCSGLVVLDYLSWLVNVSCEGCLSLYTGMTQGDPLPTYVYVHSSDFTTNKFLL